ncbi:recombinase family protein [Cribrihabitans neustonicus]|uniref:recombinase family protein n=1 Tax=Cribrihabitans neustonicus TaxID=1429085 RepID=UPI003B5BB083
MSSGEWFFRFDISDLLVVEDQQTANRSLGQCPKFGGGVAQIAADLNADKIPAPRGRGEGSGHWKQNTINGNRERGTGILNNELYQGRRIWNVKLPT